MDLILPSQTPDPWFSDATAWDVGPTSHLSWGELACNDGTPYPVEWRAALAYPLACEFEIIRATVGGAIGEDTPIEIGSAFRTLKHNRVSKGSLKSKHMDGIALDLWTPGEFALLDFLDVVLLVARREGSRVRGIGVYPWGIHFDIREGGRIARWRGKRIAPEIVKRIINA